MGNESCFHKFDAWLHASSQFEDKWRNRAVTCFDYYENEQWTPEERDDIEERGQQATTLNIIKPAVDMILAVENQKRVDLLVVGYEPADDVTAKLLTELIKQTFNENDVAFYQAQTFRDGIIGGRGVGFMYPEKQPNGMYDIMYDYIPYEEVFIDPFYRKPDASDARYMIRCVWMDRADARKRWPDLADEIDTNFTMPSDFKSTEYHVQTNTFYYDTKNDRVRISYCWYKEPAKGKDKSEDKVNIKKKVKFVIFAGALFLHGSQDGENLNPYKIDEFPFIPFVPSRKHGGEPQGLVEYITDGQDIINKFNSKNIWNMMSNRIMIENDAADDADEVADEWKKPDGLVILNSGGLGKIRTEDNLRESSQLTSYMNFMLAMTQRISGINDSMLGIGGVNERSATQQENRIYQGAAMQTKVLENMHMCKKRMAILALEYMGVFFTDRRVIRITNPNGENEYLALNQEVQLQNEDKQIKSVLFNIKDILKYDVVLKTVQPFVTVNERILLAFTEVAKTGILPPQFVAEILLEFSDIPNKQELLARLQSAMQQQQQGPANMAPPPAGAAGIQGPM